MYSLLVSALTVTLSKASVICGVGVEWQNGDIVLEDIVSGTVNILETTNKNLNSLTRGGGNGPFYTAGHQEFETDSEFTLFKYDPCDNIGLEIVGFGVVTGYDIRGLAYNANNDLLYAIFSSTKSVSVDRLYTINPYTVNLTITYIGDVYDHTETLEFDENGVLFGWSAINGLFTIDITTAERHIISSTPSTALGSLQFLAFDANDNNIIYAGFQSVYKINKLDGSYTNTSYDAHSHRGFIILDQATCDQVECTIDSPSNTTTDGSTLHLTESPALYVTDSPTIEPTNNPTVEPTLSDVISETDESVVEERGTENGDSLSLPMWVVIIMGISSFLVICVISWFCRRYHKRKFEKFEIAEHPMSKQIEMQTIVVSPSPEPLSPYSASMSPKQLETINVDNTDNNDNITANNNNEETAVIGVVNTVAPSYLTYQPSMMMSTYGTAFNELSFMNNNSNTLRVDDSIIQNE